jgi:CxxC motif-containing protein
MSVTLPATERNAFICICCPLGCELVVSFAPDGSLANVSGYSCTLGKAYAQEEAVAPKRMVCASVFAAGSLEPLSVKTQNPVPKESIPQVLAAVKLLEIEAPVQAGSVVACDIGGSGVDLVATKSLQAGS